MKVFRNRIIKRLQVVFETILRGAKGGEGTKIAQGR